MDPQLVNLILDALKGHGQKLDTINQQVAEIRTEMRVGDHETRLQKLESVAWYAKVIVATIGFLGGAAKLTGLL
jgi:hypothetical protein